MGKLTSLVDGKHCKGCSHPSICDTHGCAAVEANRNVREHGISVVVRSSASNVPEWGHDCSGDSVGQGVCTAMYIARTDECLELISALRAVYAIAGDDSQVRRIVEDAINQCSLGG